MSTMKTSVPVPRRGDNAIEHCHELCGIAGHPLRILSAENDAIERLVRRIQDRIATEDPNDEPGSVILELESLRKISAHYAKKGDLIYPLLKTKYGYRRPSDGLWTADDEIRNDLKKCLIQARDSTQLLHDDRWIEMTSSVLDRILDMAARENKVVFPLCARTFSDEEWRGIAEDLEQYEDCLIPPSPTWLENKSPAQSDSGEGYVFQQNAPVLFPTGQLTAEQVDALLNTIPMELTFIDKDNIHRYFNDGADKKLFKRPKSSLGREGFSCHPPKIEPTVRRIIEDFRNGIRDTVEIWNTRDGEPFLIRYMAVRNKEGEYLGTLECVQKMRIVQQKLSGSKPL